MRYYSTPYADMASVKDGDDKDYDTYHKIISEILNLCTDGCTEQNIMEQTSKIWLSQLVLDPLCV
jgi:hypothetical protein